MSTNYVQIRISKFSYELDEPCDSFNLTTNCVESFALKRPNWQILFEFVFFKQNYTNNIPLTCLHSK